MIEKKYDVTSVDKISSDTSLDIHDLVGRLNKKNKEKMISHGEDISNCIFNSFHELYSTKKHVGDKMLKFNFENKTFHHSGIETPDFIFKEGKNQVSYAVSTSTTHGDNQSADPQPEINDVNDVNDVSELITESSGASVYGDKTEHKIQHHELFKNHSFVALPKQEFMAQQQNVLSPHADARQHKAKSRPESLPMMEKIFQGKSGNLVEKTISHKQTLNLDYKFLRWSGEHSVKVHIPVNLHRAENLMLQPSDIRAAEALSRQARYLNGYMTEVLYPKSHDKDDSEGRHRVHRWDEEQE